MPTSTTQLSDLRKMDLDELKTRASELKNKIEANKRIAAEKDNILRMRREELTRANPSLKEAWEALDGGEAEDNEDIPEKKGVSGEIMQYMDSEEKEEVEEKLKKPTSHQEKPNTEVEDLRNQTRDQLWKEMRQREAEADQNQEENRTENFLRTKPEAQNDSTDLKPTMQSIRAGTKKFIEDEALKEI